MIKNIKFITYINNGIQKNYRLLLNNNMYKKENNASYFKYVFELLNNGGVYDKNTALIIAKDEDSNILGVLILFYNDKKTEIYKKFKYLNLGTIGLFVKEEFRNKGIASLLVKEFESNFHPFYKQFDFVFINSLEKSYIVTEKKFRKFFSCSKKNCSNEMQSIIDNEVNKGKKPLFL